MRACRSLPRRPPSRISIDQGIRPDVIVHSTSSGGTQAGLIAGCALAGLPTRVVGISADDPPAILERAIRQIVEGMTELVDIDPAAVLRTRAPAVDARFVGEGHGVATDGSREAAELTYTAKAMAGLIQLIRDGAFREEETVLFWHTGGLPGIFR